MVRRKMRDAVFPKVFAFGGGDRIRDGGLEEVPDVFDVWEVSVAPVVPAVSYCHIQSKAMKERTEPVFQEEIL